MIRVATMLLAAALASCGGPQRSESTDVTPLGQARAIEIIEAAVASDDVYGSATRNVEVRLNNGTVLNADVLVTSLGAGFAWLNEQDRRNLEGEIPEPADASQIYALLAVVVSDERQINVMILQDTDYAYIPNPRANERLPQDRTIADVEARLRRDALDFLHAIYENRGGEA